MPNQLDDNELRKQLDQYFDDHFDGKETISFVGCSPTDWIMQLIISNREKYVNEAEIKTKLNWSKAMVSKLQDGFDMTILLQGQVNAWEYELEQLNQSNKGK